ncbi:MAG TPA: hypothetical protein VNX28_14490 [Gemmataceae bacterium]|jgi:hypothetical protein|nr:hypothetical protein [Gemmataceae bacterium]
MIEINQFRRNQSLFPRAELEKLNGQYVAWSPDGTNILVADPDPVRVDALLSEAGYDPAEILVSRVALPEEVSWSGWPLPEDSPRILLNPSPELSPSKHA